MKKLLLLPLCLFLAACAGVDPRTAGNTAVLKLRATGEKKPHEVWIELYPQDAPETVANFKKLALDDFYEDIKVHRVFPKTLVQMGDPLSKKKDRSKVGTGGPGYTLPAEIRRRHTTGAVAMARLPDNINPQRRSNGSQFYITLKPMPEFDGQYTVFGRVTAGMEVLEAISQKPADSNDNPVAPIYLESVELR